MVVNASSWDTLPVGLPRQNARREGLTAPAEETNQLLLEPITGGGRVCGGSGSRAGQFVNPGLEAVRQGSRFGRKLLAAQRSQLGEGFLKPAFTDLALGRIQQFLHFEDDGRGDFSGLLGNVRHDFGSGCLHRVTGFKIKIQN